MWTISSQAQNKKFWEGSTTIESIIIKKSDDEEMSRIDINQYQNIRLLTYNNSKKDDDIV